MALLFIAAGANHFLHPQTYLRIMPDWLPAHGFLVAFSGAAEVLLGSLLIPLRSRRLAAWGLVALLVAVFPANVQMLINLQRSNHPLVWLAWLRLPLQPLLVWWAWQYARPARKTV